MVPVHVQWYYTYWYYTYFYWYELVPCLSHLADYKSVLFCYTIPRHYLTCATPGTINPRRAYDWRAGSDADYLLATT